MEEMGLIWQADGEEKRGKERFWREGVSEKKRGKKWKPKVVFKLEDIIWLSLWFLWAQLKGFVEVFKEPWKKFRVDLNLREYHNGEYLKRNSYFLVN